MRASLLLGSFIVLLAQGLLIQGALVQSAHAADNAKETLDLSGVSKVRFSGDVKVEFTHSGKNQALVEYAEKDADKVAVRVEKNTFVIERKGGFWDFLRSQNSIEVKVSLSLNDLQHIDLSGASQWQAKRLEAEELAVKLSGASHFSVQELAVDTLHLGASGASNTWGSEWRAHDITFDLSGASAIHLDGDGQANSISLHGSGASKLRADSLHVSYAKIHLSGASESSLAVSERLQADLSGASNLRYRGQPQTKFQTSGASNISTF